VDGDGLAALCLAAAELRADADLSAGHGEEGADGVRRGGGRRRGRRSDGRAPLAAPSLAVARRSRM
jgi:hypothetical protein